MMLSSFSTSTYLIALLSAILLTGQNAGSGSDPTVPCSEPLTYRIGSIDERYDLTRMELKNILDEVQVLWESAMKRDLMNYRKNGKVAIHLEYTERQELSQEEKNLSARIERLNRQTEEARKIYQQRTSTYKKQKKELQSMIAHYKQVTNEYKRMIKKWKQRGGIPVSKKPEVQNFKRRINALESEINEKEQTVESHRDQVNQKLEHINALIDRRNDLINTYNRKFAEAKKFNQGSYYRRGNLQRINIFQFSNRGELKAVLAHEFGHAFGIGHLSNPQAIMHAVMQQQNIYDLSLTQDDINALKEICEE